MLPAYAAVAQLDRVPDSDSGGRGFESRQPYQRITRLILEQSGGLFLGTADGIRTHDLQSRSLALYPAELRPHLQIVVAFIP